MEDITDEEFDRKFDAGEDLSEYFDMESPTIRDGKGTARLMITIPDWLLEFLDDEADRRNMARKAVINWILVDWADEQRRERRRFGGIA